jgi:peroxiredoxin
VDVIGIDEVDAPKSGLAFARSSHVKFPLASDASGAVESGIFKFAYLPYTVFVSGKGKVEGVTYGDISLKRLAHGLAALKAA